MFAPRHPDGAEDDGYVLSFVHDPDRGAADLVITNTEVVDELAKSGEVAGAGKTLLMISKVAEIASGEASKA